MEENINSVEDETVTECKMVIFLNYVEDKISMKCHKNNLEFRRNASHGIWMCLLVPSALIISALYNPTCSDTYKICAIVSLGLIIHAVCDILSCFLNVSDKCSNVKSFISVTYILSLTSVYFMLHMFFPLTTLYNFICTQFSVFSYRYVFFNIIEKCPFSFTYGEACVTAQSIVIFVVAFATNIYKNIYDQKINFHCFPTASFMLQCILFAVLIFIILVNQISYLQHPISILFSFIFILAIFGILMPWLLINENIFVWTFRLISSDITTLLLLLCWVVCTLFAAIGVMIQVRLQSKASTIIRKYFHVLIVVVYLTGLSAKPCFLYFASGIALALITFVETLRVIKMPVIGTYLQNGFVAYADEKDEGPVALTPFYLLVGCSAPLWLYPLDIQKPVPLSVLSGVLTIGIGDTIASIMGMKFGKHKWQGSQKTVEGSVSSYVVQFIFLLIFMASGEVKINNLIRAAFVLVITTLTEAMTKQIDNLVLPLIAYTLFYF